MGYRGRAYRDMSDFAVHFTKAVPKHQVGPPPPPPKRKGRLSLGEMVQRIGHMHRRDRSGFYPWRDILGARKLRAGAKPLGAARNVEGVKESQRVVCFSEIPLDMLNRLVERRSLYGIGFRKEFLIARGGAPLWYLDDKGEQAQLIRAQVRQRERTGVDTADPFWKLTPFIDHPGFYKGREYRWEWEREWRVIGDLPFEIEDVAFLFLPEEEHEKARQWFADVEFEHTGPAYFCPYIDPRWPLDRIEDALEKVPAKPDPSPGAIPAGL